MTLEQKIAAVSALVSAFSAIIAIWRETRDTSRIIEQALENRGDVHISPHISPTLKMLKYDKANQGGVIALFE